MGRPSFLLEQAKQERSSHDRGLQGGKSVQSSDPQAVNLKELAQRVWALLTQFIVGLSAEERSLLVGLLVAAAALGFALGRRRIVRATGNGRSGAWHFPTFQNSGEASVSRVLLTHFGPPDYHLLNHITMPMEDGTTQVDHILVSRFGVFVIETKDYSGWIFANAEGPTWTKVYFRLKIKFQNPIFQNYRHVRAVQGLLDFLPPEAIKSIVVFTGNAEFKTDIPEGVVLIDHLAEFVKSQSEQVMSLNRLQFCVGRLETARLAISGQTDVEHVESLARRFRSGAA